MRFGHQATAFAGVEVHRTEGVQEANQRAAGASRAAPADDQRPARRPQHLDGFRHRCRIGLQPGLAAGREPFGQLHGRTGLGAQCVDRKIQVNRPRLAADALRPGQRFIELLHDQVGFAHSPGIAGERPHKIGVHHVLQSPPVFLRTRRRARKHEHRGASHVGIRYAGHGIGHPGAGRDQRNPHLPRQLGMGVGHVDGGSLIAHVDDADALGVQPHPQGHDVTATQGKDAVDAPGLEAIGNPGSRAAFGHGGRAHGASCSSKDQAPSILNSEFI